MLIACCCVDCGQFPFLELQGTRANRKPFLKPILTPSLDTKTHICFLNRSAFTAGTICTNIHTNIQSDVYKHTKRNCTKHTNPKLYKAEALFEKRAAFGHISLFPLVEASNAISRLEAVCAASGECTTAIGQGTIRLQKTKPTAPHPLDLLVSLLFTKVSKVHGAEASTSPCAQYTSSKTVSSPTPESAHICEHLFRSCGVPLSHVSAGLETQLQPGRVFPKGGGFKVDPNGLSTILQRLNPLPGSIKGFAPGSVARTKSCPSFVPRPAPVKSPSRSTTAVRIKGARGPITLVYQDTKTACRRSTQQASQVAQRHGDSIRCYRDSNFVTWMLHLRVCLHLTFNSCRRSRLVVGDPPRLVARSASLSAAGCPPILLVDYAARRSVRLRNQSTLEGVRATWSGLRASPPPGPCPPCLQGARPRPGVPAPGVSAPAWKQSAAACISPRKTTSQSGK